MRWHMRRNQILSYCFWNVMAHAQKPDYVLLRFECDGTCAETRFRLLAKRTCLFKSSGGHQFSRLLAVEVCASAVVMLDTPCSEVVWRVLATYSICQFPLHFRSRASPCDITFQLESTFLFRGFRVLIFARRPVSLIQVYGRFSQSIQANDCIVL